jgi:hypothetical protein
MFSRKRGLLIVVISFVLLLLSSITVFANQSFTYNGLAGTNTNGVVVTVLFTGSGVSVAQNGYSTYFPFAMSSNMGNLYRANGDIRTTPGFQRIIKE